MRHKQDDLALCDNCGTYIYLPADEMVVSPMRQPAQWQGSSKNAPNARLCAPATVPAFRAELFQRNLATSEI